MPQGYETIYLGHDNVIDLILQQEGVPTDLTGISKMTFSCGGVTITSNNNGSDSIRWNQPGYAAGEVQMNLGKMANLPASRNLQLGYLVIYDPSNPDGLVWGALNVLIVANMES